MFTLLCDISLSLLLQRPALPPSLGATGFRAFVSAKRNVRVSQSWVLMGIRQKHEGQKVHRRGREGLQGACNTCATGCKRLMPRLWRQTDRKWDTRGLRLVAYSLLCVRADCMIRTTTQTQRVGGLLLPLRDSQRQLTPPFSSFSCFCAHLATHGSTPLPCHRVSWIGRFVVKTFSLCAGTVQKQEPWGWSRRFKILLQQQDQVITVCHL